MIKVARKVWLISGAILLGILAMAGFVWLQSARAHVLELYIFDLPGSPAIFMRTPNDRRILINGGANAEIIRRLTEILPFYSRRLDLTIAGDTNGKTVSGLIDVLNRYSVDEVDITSATTSDAIYNVFLKAAADLEVRTEELSAGNTIKFDDDVIGEVLFPASPDDFGYSKASPQEIILRIRYGSSSFLFVGRATPKIQKFISKNISPTDVLVIFSSLSASNVAKELMSATKPKYIVYSAQEKTVEKSKKEKPASKPDSLAGILLENRYNIRETGGVKVISDGKTVMVTKI